VTAPRSIHFGNYKEYFGENNFPRQVEIVGSWLEMCVAGTMDFCLEIGSEVFANPNYLMSFEGKKNKSKEVFLKEVLSWPIFYERKFQKTERGLILKQDRLFLRKDIRASA
jgi:hypothetical protein